MNPQVTTRDATTPTWMGRYVTAGWLCAAAPAAFTAILLLHALHVRLYLGRWPVVYRDDPSTLLLHVHEWFLLAPSFYGALLALLLWLMLGPALAIRGQGRAALWQALLVAVALAALSAIWNCDPTGYMEWLLD